MTTSVTLLQPDDFHLHLRDELFLSDTVAASAAQFARAIVMPNLTPAISTVERSVAYMKRILAAIPTDSDFKPLMTLYLTDKTTPDQVIDAANSQNIYAFKLYPAGATTNSASGVTDITKLDETIAQMAECELPLLVHGEVTDAHVDIFDRESVFIKSVLIPLIKRHPKLKIVLEHITTETAVSFITGSGKNIAATITPQHLLFDRNHLLAGGIKPHYYCLPILKRSQHRKALLKAATSGNPKFFLGTDSAPHPKNSKESCCGCAGCYSAPFAMQLYAEAFSRADALEKLEGFSSHFGADFYRLPRNTGEITLTRKKFTVPEILKMGHGHVVPLASGTQLGWSFT